MRKSYCRDEAPPPAAGAAGACMETAPFELESCACIDACTRKRPPAWAAGCHQRNRALQVVPRLQRFDKAIQVAESMAATHHPRQFLRRGIYGFYDVEDALCSLCGVA